MQDTSRSVLNDARLHLLLQVMFVFSRIKLFSLLSDGWRRSNASTPPRNSSAKISRQTSLTRNRTFALYDNKSFPSHSRAIYIQESPIHSTNISHSLPDSSMRVPYRRYRCGLAKISAFHPPEETFDVQGRLPFCHARWYHQLFGPSCW